MKLLLKITLALVALISTPVWAFPTKPVKIIISLPVGSGPDVQLRKVAKVLSNNWKQPVIVENKPGGSGLVAMSQLQKEPADGHTFAMFSVGDIVAFPILYGQNDLLTSIEPVVPFFTADMVLFASSQIQTFAALKEEIKKNPVYGSWAVGSIGHVTSAEFANIYSNDAKHIPYKEYGPWYIDTSNRVLAFGFTSLGSGNAMYNSGKIHYLAIAAERRDPKFPSVPTVKEVTGENIVAQSWLAFYVSKNVPATVKSQIERDVRNAISDPEVQEFVTSNFFIPLNNVGLNDFQKQIERDRINYQRVLKKYNINIKQ